MSVHTGSGGLLGFDTKPTLQPLPGHICVTLWTWGWGSVMQTEGCTLLCCEQCFLLSWGAGALARIGGQQQLISLQAGDSRPDPTGTCVPTSGVAQARSVAFVISQVSPHWPVLELSPAIARCSSVWGNVGAFLRLKPGRHAVSFSVTVCVDSFCSLFYRLFMFLCFVICESFLYTGDTDS